VGDVQTDGTTLGYVVDVPRSWIELVVAPRLDAAAIALTVAERTERSDGTDDLRAQREVLTQLLLADALRAAGAGADYCAGFALPTEDGPVTGSLSITLVPQGDGEGLERLGLDPGRFRAVPRGEDRVSPYAETSMVEVPGAGSCPRTRGIEDAVLPDGRLQRQVFMLTAVPVPEARATFVVSASSPGITVSDALLHLFDEVTSTFRVVGPDEVVRGDLPVGTRLVTRA